MCARLFTVLYAGLRVESRFTKEGKKKKKKKRKKKQGMRVGWVVLYNIEISYDEKRSSRLTFEHRMRAWLMYW